MKRKREKSARQREQDRLAEEEEQRKREEAETRKIFVEEHLKKKELKKQNRSCLFLFKLTSGIQIVFFFDVLMFIFCLLT